MTSQSFIIDPSGDVVLVLDSWNKAIGHDDSAKLIKAHEVKDTRCSESTKEQLPNHLLGPPIDPTDLEGEITEEDPDCAAQDIRIRVSSRHLILASEVFKVLLKGGLRESSKLYAEGTTEIPLPDDFADGLVVLANIIHGKFRELPKKMTPQLLIQIVLLVDKYKLHESVEPFIDRWMEHVRPKIPTKKLAEDIMSWITIALVLCLEEDFEQLTRLCLEKQVGKLCTDDLPVSLVADALVERKCKLLKKTFADLEGVVELYWGQKRDHTKFGLLLGPPTICHRRKIECDSMILGSMLKSLSSVEFYPSPKEPYLLFEIGATIVELLHLQILSPCPANPYSSFNNYSSLNCRDNAESRVTEIANDLCNGVSGLKLDDFKSPHWR